MNEKHMPDRNVGRGGRRKILDFLLKNVGKHVHTKKLQEVTGGDVQYDRRLRELRDEYGYDIASHNDDVTIPVYCYMLRDPEPREGFKRTVTLKIKAEVRHRDGFTCQMCGVGPGEPHPDTGEKARLHVGHASAKKTGGSDEPWNLITRCHVCNKSEEDTMPEPTEPVKLLTQVRKGSREAQMEVLKMLKEKFEKVGSESTEAAKLLTQVRKGSREAQMEVLKMLKEKFEKQSA